MNKKLLATLLLTAAPAWAGPITVLYSKVGAVAEDGGNHQLESLNTDLNYSTTISVNSGNSAATTDITWSGDDHGTAFRFDTSHSINNADSSGYDNAGSYASSVHFIANEGVDYSISGIYAAAGGEANRTKQLVSLLDQTTNSYLFYDLAESREIADESFGLGDSTGGNYAHIEYGSLTGTLIENHKYSLYFSQSIMDFWQVGGPGGGLQQGGVAVNATGQICLVTGDGDAGCGATVPEPMSLSLLGLGLLGLGFRRQRKETR